MTVTNKKECMGAHMWAFQTIWDKVMNMKTCPSGVTSTMCNVTLLSAIQKQCCCGERKMLETVSRINQKVVLNLAREHVRVICLN